MPHMGMVGILAISLLYCSVTNKDRIYHLGFCVRGGAQLSRVLCVRVSPGCMQFRSLVGALVSSDPLANSLFAGRIHFLSAVYD